MSTKMPKFDMIELIASALAMGGKRSTTPDEVKSMGGKLPLTKEQVDLLASYGIEYSE